MKCCKVKQLRKGFIKDFTLELVKNKPNRVDVGKMMLLTQSVLRHVKNEEEEECEVNQYLVRSQKFFRGYAVVAQKGVVLSSKKCRELSKIAEKKCVEFCAKC